MGGLLVATAAEDCLKLPLACFSFVMLVVRAVVAPGMTVPARYAYSLDIVP
jgi:hypothetical protein